jgi:uncharacterized protein (TIGR02284 family)
MKRRMKCDVERWMMMNMN